MSGSSSGGPSLSSKPWFLTEVNGDVLVWKNNYRLKVAGSNAGYVTEVSISDGNLLVNYLYKAASSGRLLYWGSYIN